MGSEMCIRDSHHAPTSLWLLRAVPAHLRTREGFYALAPGMPFLTGAQVAALGRAAEGEAAREVITASPASDADLRALVSRAHAELQGADDGASAARALAELVSAQLGGAISYDRYEDFSCAAAVLSAKLSAGSDAIALTRLTRGGAWHRALLFKVLVDHADARISASLELGWRVRGAHAGLAWNEVMVVGARAHARARASQGAQVARRLANCLRATRPAPLPVGRCAGKPFVVDLLHDVGSLYPLDSPQADRCVRRARARARRDNPPQKLRHGSGCTQVAWAHAQHAVLPSRPGHRGLAGTGAWASLRSRRSSPRTARTSRRMLATCAPKQRTREASW